MRVCRPYSETTKRASYIRHNVFFVCHQASRVSQRKTKRKASRKRVKKLRRGKKDTVAKDEATKNTNNPKPCRTKEARSAVPDSVEQVVIPKGEMH